MLISSLLFLLGTLTAVESISDDAGQKPVERRYNGMRFGATAQDYVLFKPRMEQLQEFYSLCGWVNRRRSGGSKFWFAYGTSSNVQEIMAADIGWFRMFNTGVDMSSNVTVELATWRHVCLTWSLASRIVRVYYDGVFIGSKTTPSGRKLDLDGYIVLGQEFDSYGGGFEDSQAFGGELFKVNVFDKELEAAEVKEMADGGMCSQVEEKYGRSRYLKWEDLLLEEKSGNVTEIDVGCHPYAKNDNENCYCETGNGTSFSRWDLLRGEKFFNKTVTVELVEEIKKGWNILGKLPYSNILIYFHSIVYKVLKGSHKISPL